MPKHPVYGIKGSKPRLDKDDNPAAGARERFETNSRLDQIYKERRNLALKLKIHKEALALGLARDQMIEKRLVLHQLSCMLVPMKQKLLAIPSKIGNRFGRNGQKVDVREMVAYVETCVHEALREIIDLPKAADADWMRKMEEEEEGAR
jgi:hypothetical protein